MSTTQTRTRFLTAAIGAVIAGAAAPALLFFGAGTANAIQDVSDGLLMPPAIQDISEGFVAPPAVQDVSDGFLTPPAVQDISEGAPGIAAGTFDPQPDPPSIIDPGSRGILDPGSRVGVIDPGSRTGIIDPGLKTGIGGPDTVPQP
jgi:hypothetical protein